MPKNLIALNWKMHFTLDEGLKRLEFLKEHCDLEKHELVVFPDFLQIPTLAEKTQQCDIQIGAQDMFHEEIGAFTGEVSARQIEPYCSHVLIGHSERRYVIRETKDLIEDKFHAAVISDLTPILCVSETQYERNNDKTCDVLEDQLSIVQGITDNSRFPEDKKFFIAYEPYWAIGSGKVPLAKEIDEINRCIRAILTEFGISEERYRILYGGSVSSGNINEILDIPDVTGVIVGTASLKDEEVGKLFEKL